MKAAAMKLAASSLSCHSPGNFRKPAMSIFRPWLWILHSNSDVVQKHRFDSSPGMRKMSSLTSRKYRMLSASAMATLIFSGGEDTNLLGRRGLLATGFVLLSKYGVVHGPPNCLGLKIRKESETSFRKERREFVLKIKKNGDDA